MHDVEIGAGGVPTKRDLFICRPENLRQRGRLICHYMGVYEFSQLPGCAGMTSKEWQSLSAAVSLSCRSRTKLPPMSQASHCLPRAFQLQTEYIDVASGRFGLTKDETRKVFVEGTKCVPLRVARCVGYNHEIYERLVAYKRTGKPSAKAPSNNKTKPTPTRKPQARSKPGPSPSKKRKTEMDGEDEDEEDSDVFVPFLAMQL